MKLPSSTFSHSTHQTQSPPPITFSLSLPLALQHYVVVYLQGLLMSADSADVECTLLGQGKPTAAIWRGSLLFERSRRRLEERRPYLQLTGLSTVEWRHTFSIATPRKELLLDARQRLVQPSRHRTPWPSWRRPQNELARELERNCGRQCQLGVQLLFRDCSTGAVGPTQA